MTFPIDLGTASAPLLRRADSFLCHTILFWSCYLCAISCRSIDPNLEFSLPPWPRPNSSGDDDNSSCCASSPKIYYVIFRKRSSALIFAHLLHPPIRPFASLAMSVTWSCHSLSAQYVPCISAPTAAAATTWQRRRSEENLGVGRAKGKQYN